MKKKSAILLLAACLFTACGSKSVITTGNEPLANAVYNSDSVSLAAYTGLKAEKKIYQADSQAIQDAIKEQLSEFAEYQTVNRPSEDGDWVFADFTASVDGDAIRQETEYYFILGEQEFGAEFDEKITGVSAGDELDFTIEYDSDFSDADLSGNTVHFEVNVTKIQEEILPEPTDAFLKENTDYDNYDAFAAAAESSLQESYEAESEDELREDLLNQVIDASSILQYTKEEYETAKETVDSQYASYADMFGTDVDSLYESLGVTEEDVEEEIQTTLYRTMIINAIIQNENLSLSDSDFEEGTAYYMEENDYSSKDEFLEDYGEDEVRRQLLEDKALNFLVDHADITEIETAYEGD